MAYDLVEAEVTDDIDIGNVRIDHQAALCRLTLRVEMSGARQVKPRAYRPDVQDLRNNLQHDCFFSQLHWAVETPPWNLNPHDSALHIARSSQRALPLLAQPQSRWRRKTHITTETWELVESKKILFKQLRALKRVELFTVLQACFLGWKQSRWMTGSFPHILRDLPVWLVLHDQSTARTQRDYQKAALLAQQAIRAEDAQYYQAIADRAAHTQQVEGLQGLWKQLKAVQPKHRVQRQHQRRDIDEELLRHFETLEAGSTQSKAALIEACMKRNAQEQQMLDGSIQLQLNELPTLCELEHHCLSQNPRKAPGPDGIPSDLCRYGAAAFAPQLHSVLCKAFLHGVEPAAYKGGNLCAIFKGKGSEEEAGGYRGIILADSFPKVAHAWTRSRLLPTLQQRRTIGQLGGLPSQQTITAAQLVRLHSQIGQSKSLSTATLFLDLRSAFHHMLRELIFGTCNNLLKSTLSQFLDEDEFDIEQLHQNLDELCHRQVDDIPVGLRRFLHDIHQHTWFCLHGSTQSERGLCTATQRGTRPGSPLADIGFNLMLTDMMKELHEALLESEDFRQGAEAIGTFVPPVAWMDDIAVSLATTTPQQLVPLIQITIAAVHKAFRARGLTMNLDKGKTEVVVMFRGAGAVQCRTALFDRHSQPSITAVTESHIITVRVTSTYRHLGIKFAMNMDIESEIAARAGAARQAFVQLQKAVFTNPALPESTRLSLYQSLVLTRLLYGCAIWSEISATSFRMLEALTIDHYRRICGVGFWTDAKVSDKDFLQQRGLPPFRILLAKHRLGLLQHVACHGITAHKTLLLAEFATMKGWLFEVAQDLEWLGSFCALPFAPPTSRAQWIEAWTQLRSCKRWRTQVKRAVEKHLKQENIAYEVRTYHKHVVQELKRFDVQLDFGEGEDCPPPQAFRCSECLTSFASSQQLALHEFKIHGKRAQEWQYVQSEVCPGCLKTFHTSFRVCQHLRYRNNRCWERVHGARQPADPVSIQLPDHLRGVHRLPAVRKHHGPLRPTAHHRERARVRQAIAQLHLEGEEDYAWWDPTQEPTFLENCFCNFRATLQNWACSPQPTEVDFHNKFLNQFIDDEAPDFKVARAFISWIETEFYDLCEAIDSFDLCEVLEQAHMSLLSEIHIWNLRTRMTHLQSQWRRLELGEPQPNRLAIGASTPRRARAHPILSDYCSMAMEEQVRKRWRILCRPQRVPTPAQGPYYVIHLYAGRRRPRDFHFHMTELIGSSSEAWANNISVISIDTAISEDMNVHGEQLWGFLLTAARAGRILAILLGPPCETWSNARFAQLFDSEGSEIKGPRPLRSGSDCWGIEGLSFAELAQIDVGNTLLLRGLWLCLPVAMTNGAVLLEHPAPPYQQDRPAIWRTSLVLLYLREGWLFRRHTFKQGAFGAPGIKPTSLLYANNPIGSVLDEFAQPLDPDQLDPLVGRDASGKFRTSKAKEYPDLLCQCFATAFWRHICSLQLCSQPARPEPVAAKLADISRRVDLTKEMLPDYQPKC